MPELPDVVLYIDRLRSLIAGQQFERIRLASPFLLRSVAPSIEEVLGRQVIGLRRLGKRIVIELDGGIFLVLHLMIAGRLQWREKGAKIPFKVGLAAFDFSNGTLTLTESGSKKRASLYLVEGETALAEHDPGGLEVLETTFRAFKKRLAPYNFTLKRALTDPRLLSGIGNAYSDEILHAARLSPLRRLSQLDEEELKRLYEATRRILTEWIRRLEEQTGLGFPKKVTAFRKGMAVHGRYRKPCPVCGAPIQRIVYAENEANYCPHCQTGGKVLADRALSRLLKEDWPRSVEELEKLRAGPARAKPAKQQ